MTSREGGFYIEIVKWRNQFLALFCLLVFFGVGVFYFRYWVIQKPFGIILFLGEGLDAETVAAARWIDGAEPKPLALDLFSYTALLRTASADSAVPDAAAAATAIATGTKVNNGVVALDAQGQPLLSLLALARKAGRMTGLVSDGRLTAPTSASFYGHARNANQTEELARQLVEMSEIDVVLGREAADFLREGQGGRRVDGRDLVSEAQTAGYDYVQTLAAFNAVPRWPRAKVLGLFEREPAGAPVESREAGERATLTALVRRAIELLQFHRGGYLLVIDASTIGRADASEEERASAAAEFDRAVAVATQYTGEKSVIFVCGRGADGQAALAGDALVSPSTIAPGDSSDARNETPPEPVAADLGTPGPEERTDVLPRAREVAPPAFPSDGPENKSAARAEDVLVFGQGLGAEALHGIREDTYLFEIIQSNL